MKSRYIVIYAPGMTNEDIFGERARDNCTEPYLALRAKCEELGYKLEIFDGHDIDECSWIIFWNVNNMPPQRAASLISGFRSKFLKRGRGNLYAQNLKREHSVRLALMLGEPPSVCEENYDVARHNAFDVIFTWKRDLVDGQKYFHALLPTASQYPEIENISFFHKKLLVDISGNKFSSHSRELYSMRRSEIRFFEREYPNDFDLFGTGWSDNSVATTVSKLLRGRDVDRHHYLSFRGAVENKWDVLPNYKFSICYENIRDEMDFVSNRIFDVLRCHCVPIYWGAPNIGEYVDVSALIDRASFRTHEELATYINSITEAQYLTFQEAADAYLRSAKFRMFLSENFVNTIMRHLDLETERPDARGGPYLVE